MKMLFILAILLVIAFSVLADRYWKEWIAARQRERERRDGSSGP